MKQILVTGAAGGLGAAIITDALARGWHVTGLHRPHSARADALQARHSDAGDLLQLRAVDLADPEATAETARLLSNARPWDALIHLAAAPLEITPFSRQGMDHFEHQWRTMILPAVALTQAILPGLRQRRKGCLLYCLSAVTLGDAPKGMSAYTSAKYAMWGLARSLAAECSGSGVRVTCVSPGPMDTDLLRHLPEVAKNQLRTHGVQGRFLDPAAVAPAMLDLLDNPDPSLHAANLPFLNF